MPSRRSTPAGPDAEPLYKPFPVAPSKRPEPDTTVQVPVKEASAGPGPGTKVPAKEMSMDEPSGAIRVDVPDCWSVAKSICDGPSILVAPRCRARPSPLMINIAHVGPQEPAGAIAISIVALKGTDRPATTVEPDARSVTTNASTNVHILRSGGAGRRVYKCCGCPPLRLRIRPERVDFAREGRRRVRR